MARIKYPETFEDQQTLLAAILAKNTELGTKSPLIIFTKQHNIQLAKLQAAMVPAAEHNAASGSLRRDSELNTQQRNTMLALPWTHLLGGVQFLKHFYAGAERELGVWGVTVDAQARIVYPADAVLRAKLVQAFLQHHLSLPPGESPLQLYIDEHEIDVDADLAAAADVIAKNAERNETTGESELATQQRNALWEPVVKAMHTIGAFLMGLYHEDSRKMAAWGFVVVEDGDKEVLQKSDLLPLESRTTKGIVIGSVFTNAGEDVLHLQKGDKVDENKLIVQPKEQVGMTKGYSVITVFNPSSLKKGTYTVTVHR